MIRLSDNRIIFSSYFTRPLLTILCMGFSSGLPLALTASTLSAWLFEAHVHKASIGLFAAVGTPYTLKFLWSPLMDSLRVPLLSRLLGRRRGWMLATQLALVVSLLLLAAANPAVNPWLTALAAVLVAFCSASQDIVIDAYRVDILTPETQGQGATMTQLGYRLGMVTSSAGALYLSAQASWPMTYCIMTCLLSVGILTTLLAHEPDAPAEPDSAPSFAVWFREWVIAPFADFTTRNHWLMILVFIVIYKLADAFIGTLTNPFLLDIGFTKQAIAEIVKIFGTGATLAGIFAGGWLTLRFGAVRILFSVGLLHGLTNLLYALQAHVGADAHLLALSVTVENFTGGISATAFVAYLSTLCNVHYTATQYALLSSLSAFGRTWLATPAGLVAQHCGWVWFFTLSALLALPGLGLLLVLNARLRER
jgi:PAT family beta-lactamase induction signal transducer AmpG